MTQKNNNENQKKLPSNACSVNTQVQILKDVAVAYQSKSDGSNYKDIAQHMGIPPTSVSKVLPFWKQVGILENKGRNYVPSTILIEFNKQFEWRDESSAWKTLGSALKDSWFMGALRTKFQRKNSLSSEELLQTLGYASGILKKSPKIKSSLQMLLNILEKTNLVKKENDTDYVIGELETTRKTFKIEQEKDMIQVSVGAELYAVDSSKLSNFVTTYGKKLGKEIQKAD